MNSPVYCNGGGPGSVDDTKPNAIELASIYLDPNYTFAGGIMLWDQTKQLPKELLKQVEDLYSETFPLEVRLHLASWIEENFSPATPFVESDPNHQQSAISLANQLMTQLDAAVVGMPNDPDKFLLKGKLTDISANLKCTYSSNLIGLFLTVRHCLEQEMKIVQQAPSVSGSGDMGEQIRSQLADLKQKVTDAGVDLERCRHTQEAFSVEYYTFREQNMHFDSFVQTNGENHPEVKKQREKRVLLEKQIKDKYLGLAHKRATLLNIYISIFQEVKKVQALVLGRELIRWKREQQLSGNGNVVSLSLETLQEWCEGLADIIWPLRQQIKQLEGLREKLGDPQNSNSVVLPELIANVTELISDLVTGTFVIEKQPPQVMKTNTRFTSTVRLLVGGALNVHMNAPAVSVSIVSESQANHLLTTPSNSSKRKEDYSSGDILNGNGTMEFHSATKQVSVSFRNLQLKKIKRTEKKGTESVMDEKFSVLFWTEFMVADLNFQLWTFSLPVVVIVHGNQEPQALATVTWDNAFAEWGRKPFVITEKVTWAQAGAALNMKWTAACGSPLTQENLYYLACKAFRDDNLSSNPDEYNNMYLSWSLFCKETLPDRNFTFWEWFYRALILTSNHLQRLWKEGYIMGFVSRSAAQAMLLEKAQSGLFLLRFSDSGLGGVTIFSVKHDMYQVPQIEMVFPITAKDLTHRPMVDSMFDVKGLRTLYPNIPKENLRNLCSSAQGQSNPSANGGYVKHMLVMQVEGNGDESLEGAAATPASATGGYDLMANSMHHQGGAQSPYNLMDGMDMSDGNLPHIDIVDQIDVSQILGLDPSSNLGGF